MTAQVPVYIETGKRYVFATAIDHPGWSRRGSDEASALQALCESGPRYERALRSVRKIALPRSIEGFEIAERFEGDSSTDFGVPSKPASADAKTLNAKDLKTWLAVLEACWQAFGDSASSHAKSTLRTGPRGGGRDVDRMWAHVVEGQYAYLRQVGGRFDSKAKDRERLWTLLQEEFVASIRARIKGDLPAIGPKGGARWSPRYAIRRSAWHALDHAWEIEDRAL